MQLFTSYKVDRKFLTIQILFRKEFPAIPGC